MTPTPEEVQPRTDARLLEIDHLRVSYGRRRRAHTAVDDVTLNVGAGEAVGLVGESGSGKSTIGRAVLGLTAPSSGRIRFEGADVTSVPAERRGALTADLQVVFQDPYGSLNPARTISQTLTEPLLTHRAMTAEQARARVQSLLGQVGLPADAANRYPAAFSGGQRQRIAIARALASDPKLVICDEPVSALDLSTQAQILNLLADLRADLGLAYLFIGHNLAVVRNLCDRVVVLYCGQVMETGPAAQVTGHPLHPYTAALVAAAPVADVAAQRERRLARVTVAEPLTVPPGGCPFAGRCPHAEDICRQQRPPRVKVGESVVACHLFAPDSGHSQASGGVDERV
ncbi:oligopeptide/dipeptide ABC transporter ATP-binding protein [Streptacidiphilus cavernicola]|uniref:Oligopeptide/dipeptide ABC transporter ATP-binding protein n=1 Tax=Streptacidiphilus cavernicola TaxID=3342716 RepID=A0ABV6W548_9ACTN